MNLSRSINWYKQVLPLLFIMVTGLASYGQSATVVLITTEMGDITIELYPERAPVTTANFLEHVENGDYKNSLFYRVVRMDNQPQSNVKIEVIQGGLFYDEVVDSIPPIIHETTQLTGILHTNGAFSMARMEPGSASTEFFICIGNQPSLDYGGERNPDGQGFAAFGKVIKGMDVVRAIQALPDKDQYLKELISIRSMQKISSD